MPAASSRVPAATWAAPPLTPAAPVASFAAPVADSAIPASRAGADAASRLVPWCSAEAPDWRSCGPARQAGVGPRELRSARSRRRPPPRRAARRLLASVVQRRADGGSAAHRDAVAGEGGDAVRVPRHAAGELARARGEARCGGGGLVGAGGERRGPRREVCGAGVQGLRLRTHARRSGSPSCRGPRPGTRRRTPRRRRRWRRRRPPTRARPPGAGRSAVFVSSAASPSERVRGAVGQGARAGRRVPHTGGEVAPPRPRASWTRWRAAWFR